MLYIPSHLLFHPLAPSSSSAMTDRSTRRGRDGTRSPSRLAQALGLLPGCPLRAAPSLRPGPGQSPHSSQWPTPSPQLSPGWPPPHQSHLVVLPEPQPNRPRRFWHQASSPPPALRLPAHPTVGPDPC